MGVFTLCGESVVAERCHSFCASDKAMEIVKYSQVMLHAEGHRVIWVHCTTRTQKKNKVTVCRLDGEGGAGEEG